MTEFQELFHCFLSPASNKEEFAGKVAIIEISQANVRRLTYLQLENLTENLVEAICQALSPGKSQDIVLLCLPNSADLVASILATWKQGLIALPVDYRLTKQEIENIAERLNVSLIISDRQVNDKFTSINPKTLSRTNQNTKASALPDKDHLGLIMLTSGTTGMPKATVHSLGSLFQNIQELVKITKLTSDTGMIVPLPITHIIGLEVLLAVILAGGTIIFEDFVPATFLRNQDKYKATMLVGVPTVFAALLHPSFAPEMLAPFDCFFCGGAPLPVQLAEDFQSKFGKRIIQGYGATECKIITVNNGGPIDSVGSPIADTIIDIVDDKDFPLAEEEIGEIRVTGPSLMTEYLHQPEATALVLHNGHYHTGDLGFIKSGYVFISGRSKEMIIVAGNKVFPQEVESVLIKHPLAAEVAVVGLPHKKLGQIVKAIVVLQQGHESDCFEKSQPEQKAAREKLVASFRQMCADNLKRELRPMDWEFRPASNPLPKTLSGKIDKKVLCK